VLQASDNFLLEQFKTCNADQSTGTTNCFKMTTDNSHCWLAYVSV